MSDLTILATGAGTTILTAVTLWILGHRAGRLQRAATTTALTPAIGTATPPPPPPAADDPPGPWDDPATARALAAQRLRTTHPGALLEALAPLAGVNDPYWADLATQAAQDWAAVNAQEPHPIGAPRISPYLPDPDEPVHRHRRPRPTLRDRLRRTGGAR